MIIQNVDLIQDPELPKASANARVLYVINGEHYSGAERVQDLLAGALPRFGYDVGFVCLKNGMFAQKRQFREANLSTLEMTSKFNPLVYRQVVQIYREGNYSILHAHTPRSLLIAALAARQLKCPLIYHVHSPVGRDSKRWLANKLNTLAETVALRQVNRMICVSNSLRSYMLGLGHPSEKLSVVHNGVPVIEGINPQFNRSTFTIGMVALFRPRKGVEVLLHSLAELARTNPEVRLLAVGPFESKDYESAIRQLAAELGIESKISWTGFETNVTARLETMQAMILPSLFGEGLPMVVLEAMSMGLPVIASRVEGIPEAIRENVDGLLFEPGSAEQLSRQIRELASNEERWSAFSRFSRERHRQMLSEEAMAQKIATIYDEIC